jgi:hypothetical protein
VRVVFSTGPNRVQAVLKDLATGRRRTSPAAGFGDMERNEIASLARDAHSRGFG